MALLKVCKEIIYLQNSLTAINKELQLNIPINIPAIIKDNTGAIKLSDNPKFHKKTKHINIKYHFIKELVKENKIRLLYINTKEQLADPLTKAISGRALAIQRPKIGLEKYNYGGVKP